MARPKKPAPDPVPPTPQRSRLWIVLLLGAIGTAGGVFLLVQAVESKRSKRELERLEGRWQRTDNDADYSLQIQNAAADGPVQVRYFNPQPIPVASAKAEQQGETVQLFVAMSGAGYTGSTYTLTYDAPRDELKGVYFQAPTGQSFDVVFVRAKGPSPSER